LTFSAVLAIRADDHGDGLSLRRVFLFFDSLRTSSMANTPQAKKRIRRNARRAVINHNRIGRIRTFVKRVEAAISTGDKATAAAALLAAQPEMAKGVAKGVLHKNTVSRKFSRLTKAIAALA
jgi:small subunit ribosomal protein S20